MVPRTSMGIDEKYNNWRGKCNPISRFIPWGFYDRA